MHAKLPGPGSLVRVRDGANASFFTGDEIRDIEGLSFTSFEPPFMVIGWEGSEGNLGVIVMHKGRIWRSFKTHDVVSFYDTFELITDVNDSLG